MGVANSSLWLLFDDDRSFNYRPGAEGFVENEGLQITTRGPSISFPGFQVSLIWPNPEAKEEALVTRLRDRRTRGKVGGHVPLPDNFALFVLKSSFKKWLVQHKEFKLLIFIRHFTLNRLTVIF